MNVDATATSAIAIHRSALCHNPAGIAPSPPQLQPPRRDPGHPPGAKETINRIGRAGKVCAAALPAARTVSAKLHTATIDQSEMAAWRRALPADV
jgi:hypothetical protein